MKKNPFALLAFICSLIGTVLFIYFSNPTMWSFESVFIKVTAILLFLTYAFAALTLYKTWKYEEAKGNKLAVIAMAIPSIVSFVIFGLIWWIVLSVVFVLILMSPFFLNSIFKTTNKLIPYKFDKVAVLSFLLSIIGFLILFLSFRISTINQVPLSLFIIYTALILAVFSLTFSKLRMLSGKILAVISIFLIGLFVSSSAWMWLALRD